MPRNLKRDYTVLIYMYVLCAIVNICALYIIRVFLGLLRFAYFADRSLSIVVACFAELWRLLHDVLFCLCTYQYSVQILKPEQPEKWTLVEVKKRLQICGLYGIILWLPMSSSEVQNNVGWMFLAYILCHFRMLFKFTRYINHRANWINWID